MFLIFLSICLCKFAVCEKDYSIVATALFYTDQYSRILLISGPLPQSTKEIIKAEIDKSMDFNKKVPIEVVPLYKDFRNVPFTDKLLNHLDKIYAAVYVAEVPLVHGEKIMTTMRKYLRTFEKKNIKGMPVKNHFDKADSTDDIMGIPVKKPMSILPSPKDFSPIQVYYAMKKRCNDWALGCKLESLQTLNLPNRVENFP